MPINVWIDPGHGNNDSGAVGNGYKEKDLTLKFSLMVRNKLLANGGFTVNMTRMSDVAVDLDARGKMMKGADYGVSFHCNAGGGLGYEIITPAKEKYATVERLVDENFSKLGRNTRGKRIYSRDYNSGKIYGRTFKGNSFGEVYQFTDYYSINRQAWAVGVSADIIELAFIDNKEDITNFVSKMEQYANAFVKALCDAYGVKYINNGGNKPVEPEVPQKPSQGNATVNDTILGESVKSADALQAELEKKNPKMNPRFKNIAKEYIRIGKIYGIKGDIAFSQMCHETGFLKFGGQVKEEQNNFAGIGATNGGAAGAKFATVEEGVTAHIQHLYSYCCKNPLPAGEKLVDPRFNLVTRGIAPTWVGLNSKWAWPGKTYAQSIIALYNAIPNSGKPVEPEKPTEPEKPQTKYPCWIAMNSRDWRYWLDEKTYAKDALIHSNGKLYVVDENGIMLKNKTINNSGEIR